MELLKPDVEIPCRGSQGQWVVDGDWTSAEIEEIVVLTRLHLYNRGLPCGARTIREHIAEQYEFIPLPSVTVIQRILYREKLSNGRVGACITSLKNMDQR